MKNKFLTLLALSQLIFMLVSCEVPSEIDKNAIVNREPICKITEPANGSTIYPTATTTIKAVIYDLDGKIESYKFLINGNTVPSELIKPVPGNDSTFYYTGTMMGVTPNSNNAYVITASAKDDGGKETKQEFVMTAGNRPPTCNLQIEGMIEGYFNTGDQVKISCNATDPDKGTKAITKVEFKIRGQLVATDTSAPFEYVWNTGSDNQIIASNSIEAIAYDNSSLTASADTILAKNNLPIVTNIIPGDSSLVFNNGSDQVRLAVEIDDVENNIDSVSVTFDGQHRYAIKSGTNSKLWELMLNRNEFSADIAYYSFKVIDHYSNSQNNCLVSTQTQKLRFIQSFVEDFESYTAFDFSSTWGSYKWIQKDLDQQTTGAIQNQTFPNQGYKGSYIIFNPSLVVPSGTGTQMPNNAHSGSQYAACFYAKPNNDWLITRKISGIKTGAKVSFWARSYASNYLESFAVYISDKGYNLADGNEILVGNNVMVGDFKKVSGSTVGAFITPTTTWTKYEYDLSAYTDKSVAIAIVCKSDDKFFLMVDDVNISNPTKEKKAIKFNTQKAEVTFKQVKQ